MEYKLHNGSGSLCCKGCSRQDKKLNTYDWLADIPGNAEESDMVEVQFKNTRKGYYRNSNSNGCTAKPNRWTWRSSTKQKIKNTLP